MVKVLNWDSWSESLFTSSSSSFMTPQSIWTVPCKLVTLSSETYESSLPEMGLAHVSTRRMHVVSPFYIKTVSDALNRFRMLQDFTVSHYLSPWIQSSISVFNNIDILSLPVNISCTFVGPPSGFAAILCLVRCQYFSLHRPAPTFDTTTLRRSILNEQDINDRTQSRWTRNSGNAEKSYVYRLNVLSILIVSL